MTNVDKAMELVADGMTLGLGSGKASERFVAALGDRVRGGLKVRGVPTSLAIAELARNAGIPIVEFNDAIPIDITFDGADEVAPNLDLIKGYGNALVREKIVAAASKKLVILIGPSKAEEKRVAQLGERGKLPVEVIPFARPLCEKKIADLGYTCEPVLTGTGEFFVSDNGNHILHIRVGGIPNPRQLDQQLLAIPGVVGTGLFLGMADQVIIEKDGNVEVRTRL
jgi:ribose 5-phosphate isomerase A